jgi:hypothetical protein
MSLHLRPELNGELVEILRFDRGFPGTKALEGGKHGFHQPQYLLYSLPRMPLGKQPLGVAERLLHKVLRLLVE